ncbi:uncharacterized protein Z518_02924 [Rhinocladiella mackenziei CBS 650.93]|uniref:ADF-H domain-containing protein n=1 Tax=Rhinocladiella mackenziei CBS 650.93 TaxID=1442369 RepID=A0A0D2HCS0_9EURO|nr:uncharacterized protein Z518_02924 [Rhinocladiella mackenziei CBS 650.93]KIX08268.1 hypothetical protein Z518_02924 [Rhinocladiella mackenziei CBS 650.93]
MSLNGLDGAAVAEAHQAALAEAGGWFLLKYVNRDTVELLKKGTGGVQEVKSVIEQYEDKSPLYGLVQYRRKKVILKYVPEGTSRLLQVRLTVQFQSVLETFTPHDTVFSFTTASEVSESALGLCTMLLPSASSLTSSSSSLRRRRLDEITEDAEEGAVPPKENAARPAQSEEALTPTYGRCELDELPASAVLAKALLAKRKEEAAVTVITDSSPEELRPPRKDSLAPKPPISPLPPSIDKALPETPESTPPTTSEGEPPKPPDFEATSNILLDATAIDPPEPLTPRPGPQTRHLSAAESNSISQWSNNVASFAAVKPKKKKLGPRPHVDSAHRPKTSGTTDSSMNVRPVANLPNTIRVNNRSLVSLALRPGSQQSTRSTPGRFAPSSHSINSPPPLPSPSHLQALYKPGESRLTISRPASVTTETSTATPEKLRLMKALQLRKRNILLAQRASAVTSPPPPNAHTHNASESSVSTHSSSNHLSPIPSREQLSNIDEESKITQSSSATSPTFTTNVSEEPSTKASSFTEQDDLARKRRSLSSATSSSITPKAPTQENPSHVKSPASSTDNRPASRSGLGIAIVKPEELYEVVTKPASTETGTSQGREIETPASQDDPRPISDERQQVSAPRKDSGLASSPASESPSKSRRLGPPQPLRILSGGDASASDVSEDESLMDELQHATVHEAKPVSVARSPVTPIMSKGSSDRLREIVSKTSNSSYQARRSAGSTPDRNRSGSKSGSIRSVSTALPQWPPVQTEPVQIPLSKKPTLGTGISKRIKALEVLTTKDMNSQQAHQPSRETITGRSAFSSFMKRSSFLLNQQPPNASTEASPPKQLPASTSQYDPGPSHATREPRRPSVDVHGSLQKGDTISVTARIVRDPSKQHPPISPSSSYNTPLNLFRSPLIVEHEKQDETSRDQSLALIQSATKSPTKSERGRFSFSSHRSASQTNLPRSESTHSKISHASTYKKHGPRSASDAASFSEEKSKGSRTSRLMRRMSNLTGSRNKSHSVSKEQAHPNTIQEQSEPAGGSSISESLLHVVDIGDVNVQFPESFLWKRRFMKIDDQGYLIFSPPMNDANPKNVKRKYHLSDFKRPSLPDLEREEMAWSIILDLKDGRCVQCACESKHAQHQVLQSE